ncbi:nitroreductase [Lampropedia puyangensis]|uniref:Nitroreductase n=1 Tax=Lampropedia puyangensis TaxID=1330072 RepID=A0A4S8FCD9_9BURK|nr:nitroreductase [Lampropedia puyangensis]THU04999.1 nitroreductase [Lampropedia puyangensis]
MSVESALQARFSARAFTAQEPDAALVQRILVQAAQAASGGNLQPWQVIALRGSALEELVTAVRQSPADDNDNTQSYPANLWDPYRSRRYKNGEDLYASLQIGRDNKPARLEQLAKNFSFFGAPVGLLICVDHRMGNAQWADLGIYLQSLMLLATEHGLATCPQGFWRRYQSGLKPFLNLPDAYMVAFGVSLGYADMSAPINQWRADRAAPQEWLQLRGF